LGITLKWHRADCLLRWQLPPAKSHVHPWTLTEILTGCSSAALLELQFHPKLPDQQTMRFSPPDPHHVAPT
jgi:hypothetical protein